MEHYITRLYSLKHPNYNFDLIEKNLYIVEITEDYNCIYMPPTHFYGVAQLTRIDMDNRTNEPIYTLFFKHNKRQYILRLNSPCFFWYYDINIIAPYTPIVPKNHIAYNNSRIRLENPQDMSSIYLPKDYSPVSHLVEKN